MNQKRSQTIVLRMAGVLMLLCTVSLAAGAATWSKVANLPPNGAEAGTMLLLTDGTIMIQDGGSAGWLRLTPDASGSYINGTWTSNPIHPMTTNRLYFASEVLQSGKVWVLGGEYYGPDFNSVWTSTGLEWDPITNTWAPIAAYPPQSCFPVTYDVTGDISIGSPVIANLPASVTPTFLPGWDVAGKGIPANTTVTSVDSASQVTISADATATESNVGLAFTGTPASCFGDDPSILLPGHRILTGSLVSNSTYIYNMDNNTFTFAANKVYNDSSDEEGWTKLSNGKIINYDIFQSISSGTGYAELYDPAANKWSSISPADGSASGTLPLLSSTEIGYELGPALRLLDGRAFIVGANGNTAHYNPSGNSWAPGPVITGTLNGISATFGSDDAPGAILPNGQVIFAADAGPSPVISTGSAVSGSAVISGINSTATIQIGWGVTQTSGSQVIPFGAAVKSVDSPTQVTITQNATGTASGIGLEIGGVYSPPTQLFDFNPNTNTISPVSPAIPDAGLQTTPSYATRMLMLPTGQLLFADGSSQLWVYTSDGTAPSSLQPVTTGVSYSAGVFTLTGLRLSGQSAGAAYGDDVEMDENYPIVRLENSTGGVYYCRTTNWSSTEVGPGSTPQTVNFTLNAAVTPGNYSLIVSAAGISSAPTPILITQTDVNGQ